VPIDDSRSDSARRTSRVLVVEDDDLTAEALVEVLGEAHGVFRASNVEEARICLAVEPIDAIILDLVLGKGSGETLLDELTASNSSIATIVISASRIGPRLASEYGVAFLAKPFDLDTVLTAVEVALEFGIRPLRRTRLH